MNRVNHSLATLTIKMLQHFNIEFLFLNLGGMLQTSNGTDISIDMSRRNQGLGFARIAKLVTSKNVNILKKEESQSNGGGIPPASESKQE